MGLRPRRPAGQSREVASSVGDRGTSKKVHILRVLGDSSHLQLSEKEVTTQKG